MSCRSFASLVLALSMSACAAGDLAVSSGEIVDGTPAAGPEDDAIVAVLTGGGLGLCSGTIIGPRLVLTAKHCVVPEGAAGPLPASVFSVGTGPSLRTLHTEIQVEAVLTTPGPLSISVGPNPVTGATGTDIAFLVLEEPFPGITPIPVSMERPDALVGTEVLAIGYGTTRTGSAGTRMRVNATVTAITPFLVEAVQVVCQGDSGGPLLRVLPDGSREIVGVTSFGVFSAVVGAGGCPADRDYWNRVDLHPDLFVEARLLAGECVALGDEVCNSLDDDCNGTIDDGCTPLGGACTSDADCAFAALPDTFTTVAERAATCSEGVCVVPCDALTAGDCASLELPFGGSTAPTGLYCAPSADGACTGACRPGSPGEGAFGAACSAATDCAGLFCLGGHCASHCEFDGLSCASGEACSALADGTCGGCLDPALVGAGRGRGEACASAADCASGLCGRAGVCTTPCTGADRECGADMHCDVDQCAVGARSSAGEACTTSGDCIRGACGTRDGGSFCGAACTDSCPGGADCVGGVCAPLLGAFGEACAADADCLSGLCAEGACAIACGAGSACPIGTRCEREGVASFCRRPPPSAGGCSASHGGSPAAGTLVVLAFLAARRRRAAN